MASGVVLNVTQRVAKHKKRCDDAFDQPFCVDDSLKTNPFT